MKLRGFLWFTWREFRESWPWYIFSTFLLTILLLTIGVIYSSISNTVGSFYDYINILDGGGLVVELRGLHYFKIDQVSELGLKEIYVDSDSYLSAKPAIFVRETAIDPNKYIIKLEYNRGLFHHEVIHGRPFTVSDNEKKVIWISEEVADEYQLKIGDTLESSFKNVEMSYEYEIVGIFDQEVECADFLMPFLSYYQTSIENGKYVDHKIFGVIEDSHDASRIYSQLKEMGVVPASQYDEVLRMMKLVSTLLYVLIIVLAIFVGWAFANVLNVILRRRIKSLLQYRMLGIGRISINLLYFVHILGMLIVSISLSLTMTNLYSSYVVRIVEDTLHIVVRINTTEGLILAECLAGIVIFFVAIIRVYRLISSVNLIELVEENGA